MRSILILLLLLLPTIAYGQVSAPQSVPSGGAIHFTLEDDEADLEAIWTVLNPFGDITITEIRPKFSNDLILDPPCGWTGLIRVQLILLDAEQRVKDIRVVIVQVGSPDKPVDPPNPPPVDDETEPKDEYNGENETGMGVISYENTPKDSPYKDSVADLMDKAAGHLKGFGGLKLIRADKPMRGTDLELYVWLDKQMATYSDEWQDWYSECQKYREKMGVGVGSPVNLHYQMLKEMAAGIRGNK